MLLLSTIGHDLVKVTMRSLQTYYTARLLHCVLRHQLFFLWIPCIASHHVLCLCKRNNLPQKNVHRYKERVRRQAILNRKIKIFKTSRQKNRFPTADIHMSQCRLNMRAPRGPTTISPSNSPGMGSSVGEPPPYPPLNSCTILHLLQSIYLAPQITSRQHVLTQDESLLVQLHHSFEVARVHFSSHSDDFCWYDSRGVKKS